MSLKIIQILHHSPSWTSKNLSDDIFDGWHVRTAKAMLKLGIKNCYIECWVPEKTKSKEEYIEKNGITYRTFPSHSINYTREISYSMIKAINKEQTNQILLHIHGVFNYTTYTIAQFFTDIPIVIQHHGDCPPLNLLLRRKLLCLALPLLELEHFFFSKTVNKIDYFFCLTEACRNSLNYLGAKNRSVVQTMGVDFNQFSPGSKDEARQALNFPLNSKIILYIGKLDSYKGCDKLLSTYTKLKNSYGIRLVIVGASNRDEFYNDAIKSSAIVFPRQSHDNLKLFYQSADVFVLPGSEQYNRWGGIGVNTIESLACNTPVVSGTLSHFPSNYRNLGVYAITTEQITDGIKYVLSHPDEFFCCREIAQNYYDWQKIADNTYNIYKQLFLSYYNTRLEKSND